MILASGTLCQTTSCTALAVDATAGLASSISAQFIRNEIYKALGLGSGISSLGT